MEDSIDNLMEAEPMPQDQNNEWLKFLGSGMKPRPALEGRLMPKPKTLTVSSRQQRGVRYGR